MIISEGKKNALNFFFKYKGFMKKKGYTPVTKVKNPEPSIDDPDWIIWAAAQIIQSGSSMLGSGFLTLVTGVYPFFFINPLYLKKKFNAFFLPSDIIT